MSSAAEPKSATPSAAPHPVSREELRRLLEVCTWPSEAFWRAFELEVLKRPGLIEGPVLEIGCGDGGIPEAAGLYIDDAIDLNPRAVERASARTGTYGRVRQLDLHDLVAEQPGAYRTVLANSVLEHVDGLDALLEPITALLAPGGRLVTTVPLDDMNAHLLMSRGRYTRFRQSQLQHRNLWTVWEWERRLRAAGFTEVSIERYLDGASCRFWDQLDVGAGWGVGRYRLAVAVRMLVDRALPPAQLRGLREWILDRLETRYRVAPTHPSDGCAALIVATRGDAAELAH